MQQFFYEFTKLSFDNLNRQIRLADNKAKFLLSLNLAVISGISAFAFKFLPQMESTNLYSTIVTLFSVAGFFLMLSFFFTIFIITPKLNPKNNPSKLLYWGQVAQQDIETIQKSYWNTSEDEKMKELITQIYFYSQTATEKYRRVKFSIYSIFIALVFVFVTIALILTSI